MRIDIELFMVWISVVNRLKTNLTKPLAIVPHRAACDASVLIDVTISKVMNCNMRSL